MINVMLVDDHELVRTGLNRLLGDTPGVAVTAEASSGEEAVRLARERKPLDVVLMDLNMPGMGGLEATRRLVHQHAGIKIIVVSVHADEAYPKRLLEAGACGYLTKDSGIEEIVNAIRTVHRGERYISGDIAQRVALSLMPGADQSPFDTLSHREMQVLLMITQGHTATQISEHLSLSAKTVSTYRSRLYTKLGADNDVELLHLAMRHGLIEGDPNI